jgi:hypothetical protein
MRSTRRRPIRPAPISDAGQKVTPSEQLFIVSIPFVHATPRPSQAPEGEPDQAGHHATRKIANHTATFRNRIAAGFQSR